MSILLKLIHDYKEWLYGASAIVALFLLRAAILARRERLQAIFSLEREAARNREYRIMTIATVVLLLMGGIYAVDRFVVPNVEIPYDSSPASPTPFFLPTITPTPAPPTETPTSTPTRVRPTMRPPEPTSTPTPAAGPPPACPNPGVSLTYPTTRAQLKGVVPISGTASIERFQYYKLEMGIGSNPSEWSYLMSGQTPVVKGLLGHWDTGPLPAGEYSLRLVVVDQTGNFPEPCQVVVHVVK